MVVVAFLGLALRGRSSLLGWGGLRMPSRAGEFCLVGGIHPGVEGSGHMPPGWSLERQIEQVKIFMVWPALLASVTKVISRIKLRHSLRAARFVAGGNM